MVVPVSYVSLYVMVFETSCSILITTIKPYDFEPEVSGDSNDDPDSVSVIANDHNET